MFTVIKYNIATANPDLQITSLIYFRYWDYQMKDENVVGACRKHVRDDTFIGLEKNRTALLVARDEWRTDVLDRRTTQRASQSNSKTPSRRRRRCSCRCHHHHHHQNYYSRIPSVVLELKPKVLHNSAGKPARKHSSRRPRRKWKRNTQLYLK